MKLLASKQRIAIQKVVEHHPEWTTAMVLGKLVMSPEYYDTVQRMVQ